MWAVILFPPPFPHQDTPWQVALQSSFHSNSPHQNYFSEGQVLLSQCLFNSQCVSLICKTCRVSFDKLFFLSTSWELESRWENFICILFIQPQSKPTFLSARYSFPNVSLTIYCHLSVRYLLSRGCCQCVRVWLCMCVVVCMCVLVCHRALQTPRTLLEIPPLYYLLFIVKTLGLGNFSMGIDIPLWNFHVFRLNHRMKPYP
jgi:hypothetical protein